MNSQTLCADMFGVGLVGWLNVFNAELSPERSWRGPRSQEVGKRATTPTLHCHHHQNDCCIKMGSDDSHFSVSSIAKDKVTRRCPLTTALEEKRAEAESNRGPSACLPNALITARPSRLSLACACGVIISFIAEVIGLS